MTQHQPTVMVDDGSGNPVDRRNLRTAAWGGLIGTALEQYDFVIYGTATAIVFNRIFFPNAEPAVAIIAGFATYAVGFLARPLGGLFFSRYGDRLGRKFVLVAVHGLGGREAQLLTGTCEIRESAERSAVLAVLDATNRWVDARR